MDSVRPSSVTCRKNKFARAVAKVLHIRAAIGVAPVDNGTQKVKSEERIKDDKDSSKSTASLCEVNSEEKLKSDESRSKSTSSLSRSFEVSDDEEQRKILALEAFIARLFASISTVKASYVQLQYAQSPYDAEAIQVADQSVVVELKNLSTLKRYYVEEQFDSSPETSIALAELQELKSVSSTYEIMVKKLESQLRLKDSEVVYLKEKFQDSNRQNQESGQVYVFDNLNLSTLNPTHFITLLRLTVKSIRSFVKLMIDEMKSADWDLDLAATSIVPDIFFWKEDDKCFAFESFVCREMFDGFHSPNFGVASESSPGKKNLTQLLFKRFSELKPIKAREYLQNKPRSTFARFCHRKYMRLVHPKMEASFFGNLRQRSLLNNGEFPDSAFFNSFAEMAKRVWLLHCLAFSFEPEALIFQVQTGSRFSHVYMECVAQDALLQSDIDFISDPPVAFTVVPGFRIAKTLVQCQVYLSHQL